MPLTARLKVPSCVMPSRALLPLSVRPARVRVPAAGAVLSTFRLMVLPMVALPA